MDNEELREKMEKSGQECTACEFRVVPIRIEPCRTCEREFSNFTKVNKGGVRSSCTL